MQTKLYFMRGLAQGAFLISIIGVFLCGTSSRADHTLIVHLPFDTADTNNNIEAIDTSGNGNGVNFGVGGGGGGVFGTNDAEAGGGAAFFSAGPDGDGLGVIGWAPIPDQIATTLAGSFTVSVWVKTTQQIGFEGEPGYYGGGIVAADVPGPAYDYVPIAVTGGEIAFTTGNPDDGDDTLSSVYDSITNGVYHLVTVTRDQSSGEKKIYIDGELDNDGFGVTNLLDAPQQIDLGSVGNGGDPNVSDGGFYNQYVGEMDDLQIYAGVLNDTEVAYLYNNPGLTAPNMGGLTSVSPNLVAYYTFDNTNNVGEDFSGNGYDLDLNSTYGGGGGVLVTNDAEAGSGAAYFDGGSFLTYSNAPASVLATLGSSFTLSVWINTTTTTGNAGDPAYQDEGIVAADVPGIQRDIVPIGLTGNSIGFNTGDDPNYGYIGDSTLSSFTDVADGNYHHIVVTRDEATGIKQIYIDGTLNVTDTATTYFLHAPQEVGVGAQIDASQVNVPNASHSYSPAFISPNGNPYYQGLMDDLQLYNRVLTADEIAFLYDNPGSVVTNAPPVPVDISVNFNPYRVTGRPDNDYYLCFPNTGFNSPSPDTTNIVLSPYGQYAAYEWATGGYGVSEDIFSFDDFLTFMTNDYWTVAINAGGANEQMFHFMVSVTGLDTNTFGRAFILTPLDNAIRVPTNTPFQWSGPANFSYLDVYLNQQPGGDLEASAQFDATVTNWDSPPEADPGTNSLSLNYQWNDFTGITATTPVNTLGAPMDNWSYNETLLSQDSISFVVGGGQAGSVTLMNFGLTPDGSGIQFSFASQGGVTNTVQATTNLATGPWINLTNFVGDGNVWSFVYPATNPPVEFFRVNSQ